MAGTARSVIGRRPAVDPPCRRLKVRGT